MTVRRPGRRGVSARQIAWRAQTLLVMLPYGLGSQPPSSRGVTPSATPSATRTDARPVTRRVDDRITAIQCAATSTLAARAPLLAWRGDVVQHAEWSVRLGANAVRNRLIIVRMPTSRMSFVLDVARRGDAMVPWSLETAPRDADVALNAGQFTDAGPWGWVVHRHQELRPPGVGPLAGAFVVDSGGAVAILNASELASWRAPLRAVEAIQSYPMLLSDSARPPLALCDARAGVDLTHRDARLAIGLTRDGVLLIVMSRYVLPGGSISRVPIGPTTPETAEIMRRLGAERALMLDGGLSAQLLVREGQDALRWPGLRAVPLALLARVRR